MSKFKAIKTVVDNITFASRAEARRYADLKLLEMGKKISNLVLQPKLPIIINQIKVCDVIGDFEYIENNTWVIEDVKGYSGDTEVSRLKKKLVCAMYPSIDWRVIDSGGNSYE